MAVPVTRVAMAASLILLLLPLAPAPVSCAKYGKLSKFVAKEVRSIVKKCAKDYLKQKAQDAIANRSGQRKDGGQLGSAAADSFGALAFDLSVGTSPQNLSVVLDITSELVWAQCEPCDLCIRSTTPATPTFLPNNSDSFVAVGCTSQTCQSMIPGDHGCTKDDDPCGYTESFYGAGNTSGFLATETFSFESTPVPGMLFGCSGNITVPDLDGASGFAGFSRGPLSLVSQLNISSFTYFIPRDDDPTGKSYVSWSFGADADTTAVPMMAGGRPSSTPLLTATENQNPDLYYVNLTGVQVDGQLLTIPAGTFDVQSDGAGGVFLSTTLPVTYLEEEAYRVLKQQLVTKIQLQGLGPVETGLDIDRLCYITQDFNKTTVPGVALVFDGADAAMELTVDNYFFEFDVPGGQHTCLTILPSTGGSILGSLLQVGRTMSYDIIGGQLTFETAAAGALEPQRALLMVVATLLSWVLGAHRLF